MLFKKENYQIKSNSIGFYQDLDHLDGIGISAVSANLYENKKRDTGNFLGKIQPEKTYFNDEIIKVRANWILRESF